MGVDLRNAAVFAIDFVLANGYLSAGDYLRQNSTHGRTVASSRNKSILSKANEPYDKP